MDSIPQERYHHPDSGLIQSKRAFTPIMNIIPVVAVTVILRSIIAAFALNLADTVQDYALNTTFNFDPEDGNQTRISCDFSEDDGTEEGESTTIHESEDAIHETQLTLTHAEENAASWNECAIRTVSGITSVDKTTAEIDSNDTLHLVWVSENDDDDTATIAWFEGSEV